MSLLDEIRTHETKTGSTCSMAAVEAALTEEQRKAMWQAKAERIQYKAIGKWLATLNLGVKFNADNVGRHMRGDCQCRR